MVILWDYERFTVQSFSILMIIFVWLCCNTWFRMMCWIGLMILNASGIKISSLLAIDFLCWSVPSIALLYLLHRDNKWKLLIELTSYHLLILKADISTSTQQANELPCNGSVAFKDLRMLVLSYLIQKQRDVSYMHRKSFL